MKNKLFRHKPKRTTFWKMFAKAMILPVILTLMFAALLNYFIPFFSCEQAQKQQNALIAKLAQSAQFGDKAGKFGNIRNAVSMQMALGTNYDTLYPELTLPFIPHNSSLSDKNGLAVSAVIDSEGNVICSNAVKMFCVYKTDDDPSHNKWLSCDPNEVNIPDFTQLVNDKLEKRYSDRYDYGYDITSAYVDLERHKMIPCGVRIRTEEWDLAFDGSIVEFNVIGTEDITIDVGDFDLDGYEFVEFAADKSENSDKYVYPMCTFENIWGVEKEKVDKAIAEHFMPEGEGYNYESDYDLVINESINHTDVLFDGERCTLFTDFKVDVWTKPVLKMYFGFVICFFLLLTLIAFLICWRRNVKNKAQYAFEDYQRALTNNLAHDLKTPLAVIGGYAENLIEMRKEDGAEKELRYLASIMDNVAYTDSIIAKTLRLSETEQTKELNKVKVDIKALAEKLADKYKAALEERGIELTVTGGGEVTADEDTLTSAAENLISNAVKYTRDDGTIKITADKKRLTVVNDVAEDVDTKDLTMPFVNGDKARSDKSSSGLGLAIASAAAERNGFGLKVSCKDKRFTAEIIFR